MVKKNIIFLAFLSLLLSGCWASSKALMDGKGLSFPIKNAFYDRKYSNPQIPSTKWGIVKGKTDNFYTLIPLNRGKNGKYVRSKNINGVEIFYRARMVPLKNKWYLGEIYAPQREPGVRYTYWVIIDQGDSFKAYEPECTKEFVTPLGGSESSGICRFPDIETIKSAALTLINKPWNDSDWGRNFSFENPKQNLPRTSS